MYYLIVIVGSLLLSALFSGMEIAFVSSNKLRIKLDTKQGGISVRLIEVFTRNSAHYIAAMLVGNNIALVVYGITMAQVLEPVIERFANNETLVLITQTIISTFIILFTAEYMPKNIFMANPNKTLKIFSAPIFIFFILFYPIAAFTIWMSNVFIRVVLRKEIKSNKNLVFGKPDLDHLVSEVEETLDELEPGEPEIKIFKNALEFSSVKVRDCMIPRPDITAVEVNSDMEELKQKFIDSGLSKIIIYDDKIDNVLGFVSHKEFFNDFTDIRSRIKEIMYVPETMLASKLLQQFINNRRNIAAVVDEFGGISGILTIEDIIEEITGDIEDEHDTIEFTEKKIGENHFILSGRQEIDQLNETYGLDIPESDEYETLAGFVIYNVDKIPSKNEKCIIGKFELTVLGVEDRRIEQIELKINEQL